MPLCLYRTERAAFTPQNMQKYVASLPQKIRRDFKGLRADRTKVAEGKAQMPQARLASCRR
jgi:hypothetical protein